MRLWSIVVAGGSGRRFGGLKQLERLGDRSVLQWSIDAVRQAAVDGRSVDGIVVVIPAGSDRRRFTVSDDAVLVEGGDTRSASVRAGLEAVPADATHVLVHDAARPLVPAAVVHRVTDALAEADAVVPVVPVSDTLRSIEGAPVDRTKVVAVQTPQGFAIELLRRAHASGSDATDDAALVDAVGGTVVHVEGHRRNIKITESVDLEMAAALLAEVRS